MQVQKGGARQGTWIHERVSVDLARWLSPDFAVWMDGWVLEALVPASLPGSILALPPPFIVHDRPESVDVPSKDRDLYLMAVTREEDSGLWKIGRGTNPQERAKEREHEVLRQHNMRWRHDVAVIYRDAGDMESLALDAFKTCRYDKKGFREYFVGDTTFPILFQTAVERLVAVQLERQFQRKRQAESALKSEDVRRRREEMELRRDELALRKQELQLRREELELSRAETEAMESRERALLESRRRAAFFETELAQARALAEI